MQLNIQNLTVTKSKKEITNTIYAELSINQYETMHETQIHTRELLGSNQTSKYPKQDCCQGKANFT